MYLNIGSEMEFEYIGSDDEYPGLLWWSPDNFEAYKFPGVIPLPEAYKIAERILAGERKATLKRDYPNMY